MKTLLADQILPMVVIILIFIVLLFPYKNVKYYKKEQYLSKYNTQQLKGVSCIMVVIVHVASSLTTTGGIMALPSNIGFLAVGVFFFISGYGLLTSYIQKENYVEGFISRRFVPLLIPFFISNIIHLIVEISLFDRTYSLPDIVCYVIGIKLINSFHWFIRSIIVLYLLFYLCARFISDKKKMMVILTISVVVFACVDTMQMLPFVLGIATSLFSDEKLVKYMKNYKVLMLLSILVFGFTYLYCAVIHWHVNIGLVFNIFMECVCENTFVIMVILANTRVINTSKITDFIATISYEVYLTHRFAIWLFSYLLDEKWVIILATVLLSVAMASVFHWCINKPIINFINIREKDI